MNRRSHPLLGLSGLLVLLAGCSYGPPPPPPPGTIVGPLPTPSGRAAAPVRVASAAGAPQGELTEQEKKRREAILNNVVNLMRTAATNPGGDHIRIATENLNELFEQGTTPADYALTPASREFLLRALSELTGKPADNLVQSLQRTTFSNRDARHIEDCMLYHVVAIRAAGEGDDLTRVRSIFDWIVRHIQLVPAESLASSELPQAEVRPFDVLYRGMATEEGGRWSERGWLFMALCRQIGIDVGILTYTPRRSSLSGPANEASSRPTVAWICAAAIGDQAYLFDPRIGMPIPGPDGTGVATLEEAIANPDVLGRLDLPEHQLSYGTTRADLAGSPTKIGVLIESSPGYLTPRMRLLQGQLRGEYKTTLYRDPAEQVARFAKVLGPRFGGVTLWDLPIRVETLLFSDPNFVASTQASLRFFDGKLPLAIARTAQLRGELTEATDKLVALRFAENAVMNDKKTPIPPDVQRGLDVYATYFLAECQYERGNIEQAEYLYRKLLDLIPEPGPGRNYYYMLRWGVLANLGRICDQKGDSAGAIGFYATPEPTTQRIGNLLRARDLVWDNPFGGPATPPPTAPEDPSPPIRAAETTAP